MDGFLRMSATGRGGAVEDIYTRFASSSPGPAQKKAFPDAAFGCNCRHRDRA
jgi:hypothetical protein